MNALSNAENRRGGTESSYIGVASNVSPEAFCSKTGVSTRSVYSLSINKDTTQHWFALRCTYGREKKAYDFFVKKGIKVFYPSTTKIKKLKNRNKQVETSLIPNIIFVFESLNVLKEYVYDNVHDETKYLRFYYEVKHDRSKCPMIIPNHQMDSFMIICNSGVEDIIFETTPLDKYKEGQRVKVVRGAFAGVHGIVKRHKGQQRVGIVIDGLFTIATAYIPSDFMEIL